MIYVEKLDRKKRYCPTVPSFGHWLDSLGEKYKTGLKWALGHRRSVMAGVAVLIIASLGLVPLVGAEFMPQSDSGSLDVTLEADKGSRIEDVDEVAAAAEAILLQNPAVDIVYSSIGSSGTSSILNGGASIQLRQRHAGSDE
jgi:HAE1 family hydrophobic/amphiphilic exporter-1